ncbi:hypothetical protein [Chitinophaga nivalis]|uniref:Bacteriocin n=1 Tax=Chitinophaga nivalis TaxID=2991709 RepID=A0ABT3IKY4_9BACT|nr:hypothetical protein [Chitinophaga nivalis]MCW3465687.1 hypothetical protein [Chitinophaga nivalis]MCW3484622.1 hypothetical protein [Chitinophaga nivalis]
MEKCLRGAKSLSRQELSKVNGGVNSNHPLCPQNRCNPNKSECADLTGTIICYCSFTGVRDVYACSSR